MRKITKEYDVYSFNELSEEVQNTLIEEERERQEELYLDCFLEDEMKEEGKRLLEEYFGIISDVKVWYDLSYSQGSGSMIEFDINILDINKKYNMFSEEEIRLILDKEIVGNIKIKHNSSNYYHEYSFNVDSDYYGVGYYYNEIKEDYNISEEDFNTLEERLDSLLCCHDKLNSDNKFIKDIVSMNKELTKCGYSNIEYFWNCDKEEIISLITDYCDTFLEDGEEFYI